MSRMFNFPSWFDQHQKLWQAVVVPRVKELQKKGPICWLELGSFEGRSAIWTHDNVIRGGVDRLICVDAWFNHAIEHAFDNNTAGLALTKIKALTYTYLTTCNDKFHVVYVDANHHAASVLQDAILSWRNLVPGGIMIFDDYYYVEKNSFTQLPTKTGIDSFLACYELELRVLHKNKQVIVQKF